MCAVQHHLKRMLAFATIAHVGLFLVGHRAAHAGRARRHGDLGRRRRAREGRRCSPASPSSSTATAAWRWRTCTAAARAAARRGVRGRRAVASPRCRPPARSSGKALVEDAAPPWVPVALLLDHRPASAARCCAPPRAMFCGPRQPPAARPGGRRAGRRGGARAGRRPRPRRGRGRAHAGRGRLGPRARLTAAAGRAAAAFTDRRGYAAAVLDGRTRSRPHVHLPGPSAAAYLYAVGSLALAGLVAWIGLTRRVAIPGRSMRCAACTAAAPATTWPGRRWGRPCSAATVALLV